MNLAHAYAKKHEYKLNRTSSLLVYQPAVREMPVRCLVVRPSGQVTPLIGEIVVTVREGVFEESVLPLIVDGLSFECLVTVLS